MSLLFETIKVSDNILHNLNYHNERVSESRRTLFSTCEEWNLQSIIHLPELYPGITYKCRFNYADTIKSIEFQVYTLRSIKTLKMVNCPDLVYNHKFLDRTSLEQIKQDNKEYDDVIFIREGRLTDCSFANIVFYDGMKWITPSTPLLKGTKRQKYIDSNLIFEEDITVTDLKRFTHARLINAMIDLEDSCNILINNIV